MIYVVLLFCCALHLSNAGHLHGQQPQPDYKRTIRTAISEVQKNHLTHPAVDEAFCQRWFDNVINSIDPRRLYFLHADIVEFRTFIGKLPDLATSGNDDFYRLVFDRYKSRVESALNHAVGLLSDADELDDSIEQEIPRRRDTWPNSDDERNERWRLQLKYDLLVETSGGSSLANSIEFLESRYESIRRQSDELTGEQAVAIYLDSFCRAVDPHSGYFSQSDFDSYAGGPLKEYSIGLRITNKNGRAIIEGIGPRFGNESAAPMILGCELMAIRDLSGALHNVREIFPSTISRLVRLGLREDMWVTLELYDEIQFHRFQIKWPRK